MFAPRRGVEKAEPHGQFGVVCALPYRKAGATDAVHLVGIEPVVPAVERSADRIAVAVHHRGLGPVHGHQVIGIERFHDVVARLAVLCGAPGDEMLEGHHLCIGPVRHLAWADLGPRAVAAQPRFVQAFEAAIARLEPGTEGVERVGAVADQAVGLDVPAQLVPCIPSAEMGRGAVAGHDLLEKGAHVGPHARMVKAAPWGQAKVDLAAVGRDHRVPHVVDHAAAGDLVVDPIGVDGRDRAEHDAQAILLGQLDQAVIVLEPELTRGGLDPAPHHPQLHRVQAGCRHARHVLFPVAAFREWGTVILRAEVDHVCPPLACKHSTQAGGCQKTWAPGARRRATGAQEWARPRITRRGR